MEHRQSHFDVTNTVNVADPRDTAREVCRLIRALYPEADLAPVRKAFETFTAIYAGTLPGYHGCDTWYHDAQHSLDCTLAMTRLLDSHERAEPRRARLGERRVRLGVICALFHDVGYIRRLDETHVRNGAELTLCHVTRSGEFLADFLPAVGFAKDAAMARELVQFTGYEKPLDAVRVRHPKDRQLGFLLGTADLVAQMADRSYPEKCRSFLYHEFEACGLAGQGRDGKPPVYASPEDLLRKTPGFAAKIFQDRLDGYFRGAYRLLESYFGGSDPYLTAIRKHLEYVSRAVESGRLDLLRRRPESINAHALRGLMGIRLGDPRRARRAAALVQGRRTSRPRMRAEEHIPA